MDDQEEREWDDIASLVFLDAVAKNTPPNLAAYEASWTPRKLKQKMADPEFAELVKAAQMRRDDAIERVVYDLALKGNFQAAQFILLNRRGNDFKDIKKIEVTQNGTIKVEHVLGVKQAALELMREHGVAALQPGGGLDVIDVPSSEDTDDRG